MTLLVVVPWAVWERRLGAGAEPPPPLRWLAGIAVYAAILAPWTIAVWRAAGPPALRELIGHYTVGRYLGTIENQSGPLWYYVPVLILGFFPWVPFLVPAALEAWRMSARRESALARLCLTWAIVPFLFFSFAQTKLPNYIALELPACAILVAVWFDRIAQRSDRRAALAWTAVVPVTIVLMGFAMWAFSHDNRITPALQAVRGDFIALGIVLLAGSLGCFALLTSRRLAWLAPFALGASGLVVILIIAVLGEPLVERFKPIPRLAATIQRDRRPGDAVGIQGVSGGNALLFYTGPRVATLDPPQDHAPTPGGDPKRTICSAARAFVVTSKVRPLPDPTYGRTRHDVAAANNDVLLLYDGPPCSASKPF
jgi:4-amino-4-deoxy-L-arabinose transferase-like glycosyltransferase